MRGKVVHQVLVVEEGQLPQQPRDQHRQVVEEGGVLVPPTSSGVLVERELGFRPGYHVGLSQAGDGRLRLETSPT